MTLIILTVDYEIFGNGSGDVQKCLIEPTESLLAVCNKYNIPITFFFEVCEYWAFKKEEDAGNLPQGYRPAECIENQVRKIIRAGHDLQLHIHPQWLEYKYLPHGEWKVNLDWWRLSRLPVEILYNTFRDGKKTLEDMVLPLRENYRCFVFRGGAWCIQPERDILKVMQEIGFLIDSTVAPGMVMNNGLTVFDFRNAPLDIPAWRVKDNVCIPSEDGWIWEVPIFTYKHGLIQRFLTKTIKRPLTRYPSGCNGSYPNVTAKQSKLYRFKFRSYSMLDFCSMTADDMLKAVKIARRRFAKERIFPLIVIGHSKAFVNESELSMFFELCSSTFGDQVRFGTYGDWLNIL